MTTNHPITLRERNDEALAVVVTSCDGTGGLDAVSLVEFYLKVDACNADADASTLLLTSANPAEINITAHTADEIALTVYIPSQWLAGSYPRFYRVDGISSTGTRHTAAYGPVTVVNL